VRESNDAQLVAAFLTRDAQAAGGSNPVTGAVDPSLGVSLDDAAGCTGTGSLVVRFKWIDRAASASTTRVATYYFDAANTQLVRNVCTNGTAGAPVTLARYLASSPAPSASCTPAAACAAGGSGLPDKVSLTATALNRPVTGSAPYTYTLTAKVRPDAQTAPTGTSGAAVPLLLLANGGTCPAGGALAMAAQGGGASQLRIYGTATINGYRAGCPDVTFQGSIDYIASGGTSVLAPGGPTCEGTVCNEFTTPLADPFAALTPPAASCSGSSNPAPVGHQYQPGTYNSLLSVTWNDATFAPGTYVFCNGLKVSGSVTGTGVLLYFQGGSLDLSGTINVTPPAGGNYAGIVLWQRKGNATTLHLDGSMNLSATFNGTVYAPSALVSMQNGNIYAKALIALAVSWQGGGNGGTTIGSVPPALAISGPSSLANGTRNSPYSGATVTASGGAGGYSFSATGLPAGLTIDAATGAISGTPTASGTFTVQAKVTDVFGAIATRTYSLLVNPALTVSGPASLPSWTRGRAYPATAITATGGTGGYGYAATGLPAGLAINPTTGAITGTPTTAQTTTVVVTVTDSSGNTATRSYSLTVNAAPTIATASLPNGTQNSSYSATLAGSAGTTPYTWSIAGKPAWLTLNPSTGALSGTPTATGTSTFTVTLTDASGATATRSLAIVVNAPLVLNLPATPAAWTVGRAFPNVTPSATGGVTPYTWSATGLPAGMTINPATGVVSGTPTTPCTCSMVVTVRDSANPTVAASVTRAVTINAAPTITTTGTSYKKNKSLDFTLAAGGGTAPLTWSISGAPAWVSLNATTGRLTGNSPNTAATYSFLVTVTDAAGATDTKTFTITVTN
jgi:hypothetical protein